MIGLFQSHPIIDPARIRGKRLYWILVSDWLIHYHKRLFRRPLTRPGKYLTRLGKYCAVIGRKPVLKPVWLWINLFLTTVENSIYGDKQIPVLKYQPIPKVDGSTVLYFDFLYSDFLQMKKKTFDNIKIQILGDNRKPLQCKNDIPTRIQLLFVNTNSAWSTLKGEGVERKK